MRKKEQVREKEKQTQININLGKGKFVWVWHMGPTRRIYVYVGQITIENAESNHGLPVVWDEQKRIFLPKSSITDAIQICPVAKRDEYIVLKNPVMGDPFSLPRNGTVSADMKLEYESKINIIGPTVPIALWPGQSAKVIAGHHIRLNQFVFLHIYDLRMVNENLTHAVIKPPEKQENFSEDFSVVFQNLREDQIIALPGELVSFFIPCSGIEVIPDKDGEYVRDLNSFLCGNL